MSFESKAQYQRERDLEKEIQKQRNLNKQMADDRARVDDISRALSAAEEELKTRDRLLSTTATKLGEAYTANAALRAALEELFGNGNGVSYAQFTHAQHMAYAALTAPNLGADWVPRAELERAERLLHEEAVLQLDQFKEHEVQLRRVAEAAYSTGRAHGLCADESPTVDLDAVIAKACK